MVRLKDSGHSMKFLQTYKEFGLGHKGLEDKRKNLFRFEFFDKGRAPGKKRTFWLFFI